MAFEFDPSRGWRVVADRSEPAVALAAAELEAALDPSGGEGTEIALSHAGGRGDGSRIAPPARRPCGLHGRGDGHRVAWRQAKNEGQGAHR
jgi:hypothetical protein